MITVKQLLSFLLLSMFSVVTMAQEEEENFVDNGIKYTVTSPTTVAVKGRGENKAEKLVIPEMYEIIPCLRLQIGRFSLTVTCKELVSLRRLRLLRKELSTDAVIFRKFNYQKT